VLAHELAHHQLWEASGGDFLVADRLLLGAANDPRVARSHYQTAGRYRLCTEIFSREEATTHGIDHPETFIRARSLRLWAERNVGFGNMT
jgi:hypothetical protein